MNDIVGNYTAIKKDKDERHYVDLSKKINFQEEVQEEVSEERSQEEEKKEEDINDFFNKMGIKEEF